MRSEIFLQIYFYKRNHTNVRQLDSLTANFTSVHFQNTEKTLFGNPSIAAKFSVTIEIMNRKLKRKKILGFDFKIATKAAKATDQSESEDENTDKESPVKLSVGGVKKKRKMVKKDEDASSDEQTLEKGKEKKRQPSPSTSQEDSSQKINLDTTLFYRKHSFPIASPNPQQLTFASPQVMRWNKNTIVSFFLANHTMFLTFVFQKPLYRNHQLMGDSQFVRFSKQILHERSGGCTYFIKFKQIQQFFVADNRNIGYCVSGQKIEDLYNLLIHKAFEIHEHVIILIGTNNLTRVSFSELFIMYFTKKFYSISVLTKCRKITQKFWNC